MPIIQKYIFYAIAIIIFILVLELVRKRNLLENLSWLWLLISFVLFIVISQYDYLVRFAILLRATPSVLIMFFAIIALLLLILQLSIMVSAMSKKIKNLAQQVAILKGKLEE
jgi:hypothetical protein